MLKIERLTKRYAKSSPPAVDDLSLSVAPGTIFGFIGPNGAGKSTTIKMITGIMPPDEGRVEVFGLDVKTEPIEAKRRIGYVPDNHEVYERLTGFEYLSFLLDMYRVPESDGRERMEKYLEMFELKSQAGAPIKSYSHGMKQKLCVIGALLHDPPLWVLDEPLTGLDPQSAHRLKLLMRAHCDKGNIVFFSTHVLEVAEKLCDQVGVIQGGKLIAVGALEHLKARAGGEKSLEALFLELVGEV